MLLTPALSTNMGLFYSVRVGSVCPWSKNVFGAWASPGGVSIASGPDSKNCFGVVSVFMCLPMTLNAVDKLFQAGFVTLSFILCKEIS